MSRLHKFDYRIKDNRKRNILLVSICLLTIVVIGIKLYNSYAKFEVVSDSYEMINGKVVEPVNAVEYLTSIVDDNQDTMFIDDTPDENIRYMGADPNNYVKFNNELWRIIGVMNNIDGGEVSGDGASRVKLIRAESLGNFPYYDSCADENWTDNGDGTYTCSSPRYNNNWPNSTANEILTTYYNNGTHAAYHGKKYVNSNWVDTPTSPIDFSSNGLNSVAKNLIEPATYYLGGFTTTEGNQFFYATIISSKWYAAERTNTGSNNNLTWTGNLGLMYTSDYGYASNGSVSDNRCRNIALYTWNTTANTPCVNNDWLLNGSSWQWTMTPRADNFNGGAYVNDSGYVGNSGSDYSFSLTPVAYLKSNVKIVAGPNSDGSASKPYKLTI
ncbi:MAG: hypothetical protein IJ574_01440 [Bacilli bacterium]|nr:hypothetical protein [Bacilli bacterium]